MALQTLEVDPARLQTVQMLGGGFASEVHWAVLHPPSVEGGSTAREAQSVALKQIDWHDGSTGTLEHRTWMREVEALRNIDHPNIVRLLGVQSDTKPLGILIELCVGLDLFQLLHAPVGHTARCELTWVQQCKMSMDSALALEYLHSLNPPLLHRDVKSLNLLLDLPISGPADVPLVKLADFGSSRRMPEAEAARRQMTTCVGTLEWMAPEVFCGRDYDDKVDVYSFGIVLSEILCRAIPFAGVERRVLKERVLRGARPDVRAVPTQCPEALTDLMKLCWARNPRRRPNFEMIVSLLRNAF